MFGLWPRAAVYRHNCATKRSKSRPNPGRQWTAGRLKNGVDDAIERQAGLAGARARGNRRAGGALPCHAKEIREGARGILHRDPLQRLGRLQSPVVLELNLFTADEKARSFRSGLFAFRPIYSGLPVTIGPIVVAARII